MRSAAVQAAARRAALVPILLVFAILQSGRGGEEIKGKRAMHVSAYLAWR